MDTDKDGLISFDEFIRETKEEDFNKDEEWKPLTEEDQYSDEDFKEYERMLEEENNKQHVSVPVLFFNVLYKQYQFIILFGLFYQEPRLYHTLCSGMSR